MYSQILSDLGITTVWYVHMIIAPILNLKIRPYVVRQTQTTFLVRKETKKE